jgi:DNA helicase-2/ATP-dependent DNA helicase PcrA
MVAIRKKMMQALFDQFLATLKYPPNRFQLKVLESIAFGSGNIIVDAKAGSGKTSLLKMIANLLKFMGVDPGDVLFQAFNKSIEKELNKELPSGFTARTSHSLGFEMCKGWASANGIRLGKLSGKKYYDLADEIAQKLYPAFHQIEERRKESKNARDLIDFIMANGIDVNDETAISDIAFHYGIDASDDLIELMPDAIDKIIRAFKERGEMHYIDMVYMPVMLGMQPQKRFRYVLVDEAQDLNSLQQTISEKMLHPQGRIILVGDPSQSIYGFAGADANSFNNLKSRFNAETLELNICYRCPASHIEVAQSLVPTIEAAPNAIEGTIEYKHLNMVPLMDKGSMLICRLNAPLVSAYFQFIALNKPAAIVGRSIGKGLTNIVEKVAEMPHFSYSQFSSYLKIYKAEETARLAKKANSANRIAELEDRLKCLEICIESFQCHDVDSFKEKLTALFIDTDSSDYDPKAVVTLSSVHRAKGLESDHIGIIYQRGKVVDLRVEYQDTMPLIWAGQRAWEREQELNIKYVAVTRAKESMTVFGGWKPGEFPDLTDHGMDVDLFAKEEEVMTDMPDIKEPESEPVLNEVEITVAAEAANDALQPDMPITEPASAIEPEAIKARLATGYSALSQVVQRLEAAQNTTDSDTKFDKTNEAYQMALLHHGWLQEENFSLEELRAIVSDANAFTIKNQYVDLICRDAWKEIKAKDRAIKFALEQVQRVMAAMPQHQAIVTPESPVGETLEPKQAVKPELPPVPTAPVEWAKWVMENAFDTDGKPQIVILDTETTDWQTNKPNFEMVQLAVIDLNGKPLFNRYIKPLVSTITEGAYKAHGINDAMLREHYATTLFTHIEDVFAAIEGRYIIAFNSPFDEAALKNSFHISALIMPEIKGWLCAMRMYTQHNPSKVNKRNKPGTNWKLTEALEQEGITPDENAHDALADVLMTRLLIQAMASNEPDKWSTHRVAKAPAPTVTDVVETPVVNEPVAEPVAVEETPVIEDKHIAAPHVVKVDEPNEPVKTVDPYERLMAKLNMLNLAQAEAFRDILNDYIEELRAEVLA